MTDVALIDGTRTAHNELSGANRRRARQQPRDTGGVRSPEQPPGRRGHPIGTTGNIRTTTLLYIMERAEQHRGIGGMSVGGGGTIAMSIVR